jgi:YVTN family beta-propeller protein
MFPARPLAFVAWLWAATWLAAAVGRAADGYQIFVSNEKSGDLTVIRGGDFKAVATIPVGKRPRGIHASPDGRTLYVALSGTPVEPPPQLDANGNPILRKNQADDDDKTPADKAADGIGLVDPVQKKFLRKIPAGSDPEQFCLSPDGAKIYIANEDVGAATILDASSGKVLTFVPVSREPEGVGVSPDGKFFYIGCETAGDVFAIDATSYRVIGHVVVHPRPRSVAFLPDGSRVRPLGISGRIERD